VRCVFELEVASFFSLLFSLFLLPFFFGAQNPLFSYVTCTSSSTEAPPPRPVKASQQSNAALSDQPPARPPPPSLGVREQTSEDRRQAAVETHHRQTSGTHVPTDLHPLPPQRPPKTQHGADSENPSKTATPTLSSAGLVQVAHTESQSVVYANMISPQCQPHPVSENPSAPKSNSSQDISTSSVTTTKSSDVGLPAVHRYSKPGQTTSSNQSLAMSSVSIKQESEYDAVGLQRGSQSVPEPHSVQSQPDAKQTDPAPASAPARLPSTNLQNVSLTTLDRGHHEESHYDSVAQKPQVGESKAERSAYDAVGVASAKSDSGTSHEPEAAFRSNNTSQTLTAGQLIVFDVGFEVRHIMNCIQCLFEKRTRINLEHRERATSKGSWLIHHLPLGGCQRFGCCRKN
jgi:hypothetical protein